MQTVTITREINTTESFDVKLPAYFKHQDRYFGFPKSEQGFEVLSAPNYSVGYLSMFQLKNVPADAVPCTAEEVLAAAHIAISPIEQLMVQVEKSIPHLTELTLTTQPA